MSQAARGFSLQLLRILHHDGSKRQALEHGQGVAAQIGRRGEQQDLDHAPRAMQLARDHKAVATVVTLATNHRDAIRVAVLFQNELRDGRAGVLHQRERGHTEAFGRGAVDLPHLRRSGDLHIRSVAESSRRRKPPGSPMAMRWSPT